MNEDTALVRTGLRALNSHRQQFTAEEIAYLQGLASRVQVDGELPQQLAPDTVDANDISKLLALVRQLDLELEPHWQVRKVRHNRTSLALGFAEAADEARAPCPRHAAKQADIHWAGACCRRVGGGIGATGRSRCSSGALEG